jgi:uncharacterized protein (TIGR03118 family)
MGSLLLAAAAGGGTAAGAVNVYRQTDLVADVPGLAPVIDPDLINPWGVGLSPDGGALWVANQGSGTSTLYVGDVAGSPLSKVALTVSIPGGGNPTGQVFNPGASDFVVESGPDNGRAFFIFASLTGVLSGWNPGVPLPFVSTQAQIAAVADAVYTGLAISSNAPTSRLYAADVVGGKLDVYDSEFNPVALPAGAFEVPGLNPNFHPFNVQNLGGEIFVAYEDLTNPATGAVAKFDTDGNFVDLLVEGGALSQPWGLTLAPDDFGAFSNALLVGNNGDGRVSAYNPVSGSFLGQLADPHGNPVSIEGLWALQFGNGVSFGDRDALYFTAGVDGFQHGLVGKLQAVPEPSTAVIFVLGGACAAILTVRRAAGRTGRRVDA